MTEQVKQIIALELESLRLKKLLIEKYSKFDDPVSKIITQDSRAAIRQTQDSINFFAKL